MSEYKEPSCEVWVTKDNKLQLTVEPDEEWIDFLTNYSDIFMNPGIGYWARGMERDDKLGWLCFEHGDEVRPPVQTPKDVLKKWRAGEKLPERWFRIDRNLAIRAQAEGIKLKGVGWYDAGDTDAFTYDCVIQRVVFGEEKYG